MNTALFVNATVGFSGNLFSSSITFKEKSRRQEESGKSHSIIYEVTCFTPTCRRLMVQVLVVTSRDYEAMAS